VKQIWPLLLFSSICFGQQPPGEERERVYQPAPAELKDAQITIRLKNGQVQRYSGNDYKIVERHLRRKVPPAAPPKVIEKEVLVAKPVFLKNRITALIGPGFDGLKFIKEADSMDIGRREAIIFGVSYTRQLNLRWSVSAEGFSNRTYLFGGGVSF